MVRMLAEVFPVSNFLQEEMETRGWTREDVHSRLNNDPVACCAADFAIYSDDKGIILDGETAANLAQVFDVSTDYLLNLDHIYRTGQPLPAPPAAESGT